MAGVNNNPQVVLNLTDDLTRANQRTGRIALLANAYPPPPGVSDDFWSRILNTADTQVRRINPQSNNADGGVHKFRKAYNRLLEYICTASATGNSKQRAIFRTRAHLQNDFFVWVKQHGQQINRTTPNWTIGPAPA